MTKVIDVSAWNGRVDWNRAKKQKADGAILKIIRRDLARDKQFNANFTGCEENKINWGVYNYSYATTAEKAKADMVLVCDILDSIKDKKYFTLGVWFDIEDDVQKVLTKKRIAEIINAAQSVVEKKGYKFGVYTGYSWHNAHIDADAVKCKRWWIARYYAGSRAFKCKENPDQNYKPIIKDLLAWQYTSKCQFYPHISDDNSHNVDISVLYDDSSVINQKKKTITTVKKTVAKKDEKQTFAQPALPARGYYKRGDGMYALVTAKEEIKKIQAFLNWYVDAGLKIDGEYGTNTRNAIIKFQKKSGIKTDGLFGEQALATMKTITK